MKLAKSDFGLSTEEARDYARCEETIEQNANAMIECGRALAIIRDRKLYRHQYDNFDLYCKERWGWTGKHGWELITAVQIKGVLENLGKIGNSRNQEVTTITQINTPSQLLELRDVAPEDIPKVIDAASAITRGAPTAKAIKQAKATFAAQRQGRQETIPDECPFDPETDEVIHDPPEPEENRFEKLKREGLARFAEVIKQGAAFKKSLDELCSEPWGVHIERQAVTTWAKDIVGHLKMSAPARECVCQGSARKTCKACQGIGWVSVDAAKTLSD